MSGVMRIGKASLNMAGNVACRAMSDGFVLGTLAAVAWGLADVLVTYLSRRGGFLRTLLLTHAFGVALLVVVALALDYVPGPSAAQLLVLGALGPVAIAAYAG